MPGIKKRIGWHTFRHTYSTTLIANGENVKVVQELMRHANSRCTLDVYSQARVRAKREAQQRIVEMVVATGNSIWRTPPSIRLIVSIRTTLSLTFAHVLTPSPITHAASDNVSRGSP
ncbi:MAG TPA: tyrosine-type recombinase/integrase [Pyrinomonadaceae bacterium]|nr:tyrosine-type recombinase/integrase [Pyrinomonadaceae bacterium]